MAKVAGTVPRDVAKQLLVLDDLTNGVLAFDGARTGAQGGPSQRGGQVTTVAYLQPLEPEPLS